MAQNKLVSRENAQLKRQMALIKAKTEHLEQNVNVSTKHYDIEAVKMQLVQLFRKIAMVFNDARNIVTLSEDKIRKDKKIEAFLDNEVFIELKKCVEETLKDWKPDATTPHAKNWRKIKELYKSIQAFRQKITPEMSLTEKIQAVNGFVKIKM